MLGYFSEPQERANRLNTASDYKPSIILNKQESQFPNTFNILISYMKPVMKLAV